MSAIGSMGDVLPYVALGRELKRGHGVTLVANPRYESLATQAGFAFVPVGTLAEFERFLADADLWEPSKMSLATARAVYYYPLLPAILSRRPRGVRVVGAVGGSSVARPAR